jgi:ribosomal protein S20
MGVSNGKTAQGRIVNGMYVDIGSKFESIDSIKKEIDASNKKIQTAIKSGTVEKGNETAKANLKSIEKRVNEELTQHPEEIVKKNWVFRDILKKVDEIAREYMDNPLIATNVNYK